MNFIKIIKNNLPPLFRLICRSLFHWNDRGSYSTKNLPPIRSPLQPTTYHLQPNRAFTLIETLVAISILMVAVASPLTIAQKGLASAIYAKDQIIASYLAQDAIEYIINASGKNVADGANWLNVIKDKCGTRCVISTDVVNFTGPTAIVNCGGSCSALKYDSSSGSNHIYSQTGSSSDSPFTRSVTVIPSTTQPDAEALITVTMSWKDKGVTRTLNFYTRIYNWKS